MGEVDLLPKPEREAFAAGRIAGLREAGTIAAEKACALSEQGEDQESSGASEVWQAIQARISSISQD